MKRILRYMYHLALIFGIAGLSAGCIPQWQRQYLGDPIMQFDEDALEKQLNDHVHPRREGTSGGASGPGGGCGC